MKESNNAYDKIWYWYPQELTRFSSIWWFFLLFPRQNEGYGPKQMMFSLVSRVGNHIRINKVSHSGVERSRRAETLAEPFPGISLGWYYDGDSMHQGIIKHPVMIQVTPYKAIYGWDVDGYGGEIVASEGRSFATTAFFRGERGEAHFEVWGETISEMTSPALFDRQSIFGGANVLAWRHLSFEGEFSSPAGTEKLEGAGYFQRICLNIMPFPWKWILARFADGSFFSCYIPYLGPHLLRRGDWFFPEWVENLTLSLQESAYFCKGMSWRTVNFSKVSVNSILSNAAYPHFLVSATAENGDFLRFRAVPYTHAQVLLERQLFGPLSSTYNYNEYLFNINELVGSIDGKPISSSLIGPGFGNCEYTWGLGV
ncbi:MAG: hypothetical protein AMJ56_15295 [Anaerolineae bacterium SG8_19]|jgi:hypothetical protein|nr:MAG: hypothetical protein AMJ56_15295 [Anaerolineae bacterium SG8_19]